MERNIIYKKSNKGITLAALVITIIVLLILAGVSLNLVAGSNGIMNRATKAVDVTNMARIKEDIELKIAEMQMDYYSESSLRNQYASVNEYIKAELEKGVELPNGAVITSDSSGNLNYDGVQIGNLNPDGSITIDGELNGGQIVTKYTVSYNANGGQGGPASARYENGETVTVDFTQNPTKTGYNFLGWSTNNKAETAEYASSGTLTVNKNVTLYAVWNPIQEYHAVHPELHIPTGFAHTEGTVDTGYVIKDSEGNEFVWIPVANDEAYAKKLGITGLKVDIDNVITIITSIKDGIKGDKLGVTNILGKQIQDSVTAQQPEYPIVKKAGGFWVGRYEAGIASVERTSELESSYWDTNPTISIKKGNEPVRMISQSKALEIANNWKSGSADTMKGTVAFQSALITGAQWDAMCKFIGWDIADGDCSSWGNCANVVSKVYSSLTHSTSGKSDWRIETGSIQRLEGGQYNWVFPTGMFETVAGRNTSQKNIYDVAGNVYEWTTEITQISNGENAILRGGATIHSGITESGNATIRDGRFNKNQIISWCYGFRLVLYVE